MAQDSDSESNRIKKAKYYIDESRIHGKGAFTSKELTKNERVGRICNEMDMLLNYLASAQIIPPQAFGAHMKDYRTKLGKFINHSNKPNCKLVRDKDNLWWWLVANRDIKKDREMTIDYTDGPWFVDRMLHFLDE